MNTLVVLLAIITTIIINAAFATLPCASHLRIIRPDLFKHCGSSSSNNCSYDQWSPWKTTSKVKSSNCESKKAYVQTRVRHSFTKTYSDQNEIKYTCKHLTIICSYV